MKSLSLRGDDRGATVLEFALAAPAMMMFIIGIAQLGMLCMADAGLRSAVAEGARAAAVFPTPTDEVVVDRINAAKWGMQSSRITAPTIVRQADANGNDYLQISMSYSAPLDFIFLQLPPVTLTETRRVFIQGTSTGSSSSSSSTSSTSSTSTGGATSAGGTTTSAGGTTTSAGGTTTTSGGTTTTSSTTTSSSGNGNGNGHAHGNGNGNGNANGHDH